jgi:hypothetical protein
MFVVVIYLIVGNLFLIQVFPEFSLFYFPFITTGKIVDIGVCPNTIQLCETIEYVESEYLETNTCISPIPFGGKNEDLYTMYLRDKPNYLNNRPNKVHILIKNDECSIIHYDYSSVKYKLFVLLIFSLGFSLTTGFMIHVFMVLIYKFICELPRRKYDKDKLEEIEFYV